MAPYPRVHTKHKLYSMGSFLKRMQCWDGVESLQGSGRSYEEERGVNTIKIYVHYETVEEYKCYILKIASVHTHQCFTLMGL